MANPQDVIEWFKRDLSRFASLDNFSVVAVTDQVPQGIMGTSSIRMELYTDTNKYCITAKENDRGGYLGCVSESRKSRAGEDWNRGNDLSDGVLCEDTWRSILGDIISYELVKISNRDEPQVFGSSAPEEGMT